MQYYIRYNDQTVGPMAAEQLAAYHVDSQTMVSANGGDWKPLYSFPELMQYCSGQSQGQGGDNRVNDRRIACGVLAILVGGFGLQYFLAGKTTGGIINIALTLVTCGLWSLVNLIQGIMILCMSDEEWRRKFVDSPSTFPIF